MNLLQNTKILFSEEQIATRVKELGEQITKDYQNKELVVICTLKGSVIFFADLVRALKCPLNFEFLQAASYGNEKKSSGEVKLSLDISTPLENKHILLVEDIVDTGITLNFLKNMLLLRKPASLKTCSFLFKPECLQADISPDYLGFSIGNEFVVGYGLDYAQNYRELPYIGILEA